jgi:hypothetical protein
LRARRRKVLYAWLPIFVLSVATGPACAMQRSEPVAAAAVTARHAEHQPAATHHEHHAHVAAHDSQPANPEPHPCPHCPLGNATNVGHDACAAAEKLDQSSFVTAKDAGQRPQLALAPNWLLPAARAAPPLNAHPPPRTTLSFAAVPLRVTHCVLLI